MFIIFLTIVFYYVLKEKSKTKQLTYKNENSWIKNLEKSFKNIFNWEINISMPKMQFGNKILLMSTHQSLVDFLHVSFLTSVYFPEHRKIYIMKDLITKIPLIKHYIKRNSIVVTSDKKSTEMQFDILDNIGKEEKVIIIIYPEGAIYAKENIEKSNKFCEKNGIKKYNNLLAPRTKGVWNILQKVNIDTVLQNKITYEDDLCQDKGKKYLDFLLWNLPKICNMKVNNVTYLFKDNITKKYEDFDKNFYNYWQGLTYL